jgi:hypothetical protein
MICTSDSHTMCRGVSYQGARCVRRVRVHLWPSLWRYARARACAEDKRAAQIFARLRTHMQQRNGSHLSQRGRSRDSHRAHGEPDLQLAIARAQRDGDPS